MINRPVIQDAIESWRDECVEAGIDSGLLTIFYDENLMKDFARYIMVKIREA
jgi:hypothetical protein